MESTIGDYLSDEPTTEAVAEVIETPEAKPETAERPRGPDGKFVPKETGVETPTAEPAAEPVTPTERPNQLPQAEYAALRDERQKRQQLEARLAELEASLQPQPQVPAPPDMFDDPDGFAAHLRAQILQELQPTLQHGQTLTRAEVSEMLARQKYEDYDDTVEVFKEALAVNPFLMNQLQQARDPATFAYNAGKQFQAAKAFGSEAPPSREQIEAELREKIMSEIGLKPQAPSTLAADRSVGSRSGPEWSGPTPLGKMLG